MKNKNTTILLSLFLGAIGVHRFYLGQIGIGMVYLLFSWTFIPLIVSIIDFIIFITMSQEKFNLKYNNQITTNIKNKAINFCPVCETKLTVINTPTFNTGRLIDGKQICTKCFRKSIKADSNFVKKSKTYSAVSLKKLLDNYELEKQHKKEEKRLKDLKYLQREEKKRERIEHQRIQEQKDLNAPIPTISSLVKSVKNVDDIKKLDEKSNYWLKKWQLSDYENSKFEKLYNIYEEACNKSYDTVFYYQFVPNIKLDTSQAYIDFAYKTVSFEDYKEQKKNLKSKDFDWVEITGNELIDDLLENVIEKKPNYWNSLLEYRQIVESDKEYKEKIQLINNLTNKDSEFSNYFFSQTSNESPGVQWVKEQIHSFNVPLVDKLYDMGYTTPDLICEIDINEIQKTNGFGLQKIEQLKKAIRKIKSSKKKKSMKKEQNINS